MYIFNLEATFLKPFKKRNNCLYHRSTVEPPNLNQQSVVLGVGGWPTGLTQLKQHQFSSGIHIF